MTDRPPGPPRTTDDVRVRWSTSGSHRYVTVSVDEGARLERVVTHLTGLDPRAVFVSATGGTSTDSVVTDSRDDLAKAAARYESDAPAGYPPPTFDATKPHSARVSNYWLGGKDNFPVDRKYGDEVSEIYPQVVDNARACRAFLARAVRYLVMEGNIHQFLDIGTGLPIMDNTHEVAQRLVRESRVVYVDNDPLVLSHARALHVSSREGAVACVDADVRDPDKILAVADETIDFTLPVAVLLLGVMGHVPDTEQAYAVVKRLVGALPPGGYLVVSDGTVADDQVRAAFRRPGGYAYEHRTPEQIAHFFDGLDLVEPGVVPTPLWRPDPGESPLPLDEFCGVGRRETRPDV